LKFCLVEGAQSCAAPQRSAKSPCASTGVRKGQTPWSQGVWRGESACKPDSVEGDHPSGHTVADVLVRPTRDSIDGPPMPLLGLAPGGVCRAVAVACDAGELLPHRFTLACALSGHRRSALCCTFRRVTPPGCYPAPCPVESGLSSVSRPRSPGGLTTPFYEPSRFRRPASQPVRPARTAATTASQITDSVGAGLPPILATKTMSPARRSPVTAPWNRSE